MRNLLSAVRSSWCACGCAWSSSDLVFLAKEESLIFSMRWLISLISLSNSEASFLACCFSEVIWLLALSRSSYALFAFSMMSAIFFRFSCSYDSSFL